MNLPLSALLSSLSIASLWAVEAHADSVRDEEWRSAALDYFAAEDGANAVYVGLGAAQIGAGTALIAGSSIDELQAAGVPILAVGGIELVIGVVYLALTPGWKQGALAAFDQDPRAFQKDEVARVGAVESLFPYFKIVEAAALVSGVVIASVGAAEGDRTITGVGAGLATAATVQLSMEHITHDIAKDYLRRIDAPSVSPFALRDGFGVVVGGAF